MPDERHPCERGAEREFRKEDEKVGVNEGPCCSSPIWVSRTIPTAKREPCRQQGDAQFMSEEEAFEYYRKTVIGSLQDVFNTNPELRERAKACNVYESEMGETGEIRVCDERGERKVHRGCEAGYRKLEGGYRNPEEGFRLSKGGKMESDRCCWIPDGACRDCERVYKGSVKGNGDFRKEHEDLGNCCLAHCGVSYVNSESGWNEEIHQVTKNRYEPRITVKHHQGIPRTQFDFVKEGKAGIVAGRYGGRKKAESEEAEARGHNSESYSKRWRHRYSWRDRSWSPFTRGQRYRSFSADEAEEVLDSSSVRASWFNGREKGGGCQARHRHPRGFYVFVPFDDGDHSEGEDDEWTTEKGPRVWAQHRQQTEAGERRRSGTWDVLKRNLARLAVAKGLERRAGWAEERELMMDILLQEILHLEATQPVKRSSKESRLKWFVESCPCVRAIVEQ